jgi:hypothetical protein
MKRTTGAALALLALAGLSGCGKGKLATTTPTENAHNRLAISADDPTANGVVRGLLAGRAEDYPLEEPVSNARVEVFQYTISRPPIGPDGTIDTTEVERTSVGSLTTDAAGSFEITAIPAGNYMLTVTPPEGSVWMGTEAWTITSTGSDEKRIHILLERVGTGGGGDTPPPSGGAPGDSLGAGGDPTGGGGGDTPPGGGGDPGGTPADSLGGR